ncbi:NAD(P)-dependent oxidoreductase [Epilithonimonas sp.]|uniref:NAD-dependent epimerase/dehydratase family protein n=1 Tax=Epilithonimonas sp. TaxID=2894511 RepID=UPI00289675B4|nr:NAD(P)-dependent oxidoreductase [Epilithonimonas sp.]
MKKILIFGANSILTTYLLKQHSEDDVTIVYHSKPLQSVKKNYHISDVKKIDPNQDVVYIVSALISNDIEELENIIDVNIILIKNITEHFTSSKFIYFSSVAVYDGIKNGTIDNSTAPCPSSLYGISKLFAEKIIENCTRYAILRISSMYGPHMKESTFLPKVILSAIEKQEITLLGNGERKQNYIHAKDVAFLAKRASLENQNKIILAISPENHTNLEIAGFIRNLTNCKIVLKGTDQSRSIEYYENDPCLSNHDFVSMKQGLKELIEWKTKQF